MATCSVASDGYDMMGLGNILMKFFPFDVK